MVWIALTLLGTLLNAGNSILDKHVMRRQSIHPFACAASFAVVGLPVAIIGLLVLQLPTWPQALLGIGAGIIFIPAAWLYYDTLTHTDISRVVPFLRLTSLLTLLLGVLFQNETLTRQQCFAFVLLFLSGILLSFKSAKCGLTWNGVFRLLPATILLALNGTALASTYRTTSVWSAITWESLGMVISVVILYWLRTVVKHSRTGVSRCTWSLLFGGQTVRLVTQVMTALAIVHGVPVAITSTLSNANLVWVWLLAVLFLQERSGRDDLLIKCCGIAGMSLGIYLLK